MDLTDPTAFALDIAEVLQSESIGYALYALARSPTGTLRQREIRVLTPEDFVIFKVLSTR